MNLIIVRKTKLNYFIFLIATLLAIGIFFRFVNLDRKFYWSDEASTSLRIVGYPWVEVQQALEGRVVSIEEVLKYQRLNPERGFIETIKTSARNASHPPFYFLMARFWMQWFGNSIAVTRSLSASISLLVFPCIYWLCLELFESSLVGWIAIALVAVSPFHVLYAQEARMYSLLTVEILLSSATLLRAMRLKTMFAWIIYSVTLGLGFYTHLFFAFVPMAHGIYIIASNRFRLRKTFMPYGLAFMSSLLIFVPWILVILAHRDQFQSATAWATQSMPLSSLITNWIYNLSYIFMDFWYIFTYIPDSPWNWHFGKFIIPLLLFLVSSSLYILIRQTPERIWLFLLTLIATNALAVILPDLISGGYQSIMARYFIPCYLGIQIAVAYLLATRLNSISLTVRRQKLWRLITIVLISGGVLSCTISAQAETWWNKRTTSDDHLQAVRIINYASQPLLIAESIPLSLSHKLNPKVKLMVVDPSNKPEIPTGFSQVFFLEPSKTLRLELEKELNSTLDIVYKGRKESLWQLDRK